VAGGGVLASPAQGRRAREDLSPARERTYRALVAAVSGTGASYADQTTAGFRAWYRSSLPHVRRSVNATLDAVGRRTDLRGAHASVAAQAVALTRIPVLSDPRCAPA
jgi:hypothetical protein